MNYKEEILALDKSRYELFEQEETKEREKQIDEQAEKILDLITEGEKQLEFEFIFDQLTRLGQAPQLLYDDDGRWAITGDGYATVPFNGPVDWEAAFSVPKEKWFDSIREALRDYLNKED